MAAPAEIGGPIDDARARLLSSFVPTLMLRAMDQAQAPIEPPTTHEYEAVALFAVRMHYHRRTQMLMLPLVLLMCTCSE